MNLILRREEMAHEIDFYWEKKVAFILINFDISPLVWDCLKFDFFYLRVSSDL